MAVFRAKKPKPNRAECTIAYLPKTKVTATFKYNANYGCKVYEVPDNKVDIIRELVSLGYKQEATQTAQTAQNAQARATKAKRAYLDEQL